MVVLLRTVRELTRNIEAHSGATNVLVRLSGNRGRVVLDVTDDGVGFELSEASKRPSKRIPQSSIPTTTLTNGRLRSSVIAKGCQVRVHEKTVARIGRSTQ